MSRVPYRCLSNSNNAPSRPCQTSYLQFAQADVLKATRASFSLAFASWGRQKQFKKASARLAMSEGSARQRLRRDPGGRGSNWICHFLKNVLLMWYYSNPACDPEDVCNGDEDKLWLLLLNRKQRLRIEGREDHLFHTADMSDPLPYM